MSLCQRLSQTELKARSQNRRLQALRATAHTLVMDTAENLGECTCGRWAMADRVHTLSPVDLKRNHDLHVAMVSQERAVPPEPTPTIDTTVGTFPVKYMPLRDRMVKEAKHHPAFSGMSPEGIVESAGNRLVSFVGRYPYWYGRLAEDHARKPLTDAQRTALERARERKREIQREVDTPYASTASYANPRSSQTEGSPVKVANEAS